LLQGSFVSRALLLASVNYQQPLRLSIAVMRISTEGISVISHIVWQELAQFLMREVSSA